MYGGIRRMFEWWLHASLAAGLDCRGAGGVAHVGAFEARLSVAVLRGSPLTCSIGCQVLGSRIDAFWDSVASMGCRLCVSPVDVCAGLTYAEQRVYETDL